MTIKLNNYFSVLDYFKSVSIDKAKKTYKDILKKFHPDINSDPRSTEITKVVIKAFQDFLNHTVDYSFRKKEREYKQQNKSYSYSSAYKDSVSEMLKKVIDLDCHIEIIGTWIYCFDSKPFKETLKGLGFWFSGKNKAWIYSGSKKRRGRYRSGYTMDDIKEKYGFETVK